MKFFLIISLLITQLASAEEIKLLTWNVFMLPKPINFSKQKERTKFISEELLKSDYDIILLQESFQNKFIEKITNDLKSKYPFQNHLKRGRSIKHILNSGLLILSKLPFKVLDEHYFTNCVHADCFASKGVQLIEINSLKNNTFQLANTHLQAWPDLKAVKVRESQIQEIKMLFDKHKRSHTPQILAGDLNIDGKKELEYIIALNTLKMTSSQIEGNINGTNGFKVDCYSTPGGTKEIEWLDHFWIKSNGTSQIIKKKVRPFTADLEDKSDCPLSDHYALEAVLSL